MREVAKISDKDREALFRNTAANMGMTEAIIEKDFWVCWLLDYLFHHCEWKEHIAFRGGTSLSKSFGLIKRFSEDIDLIPDWRILGYGTREPWGKRSNTKQDSFNKEANERTKQFLKNKFVPQILADITQELSSPVNCLVDEYDNQTVKFKYPKRFSDNSILQELRLETGVLAAWTPAAKRKIIPYSAEVYPRLFSQPDTEILTVHPERTFWEKITILHREANRREGKPFPLRYSRHYYDLYCMAQR